MSSHLAELSRRERQIMDILYRRGRATAGEVMAELSADTTYSTVRSQLRTLGEQGLSPAAQAVPKPAPQPAAKKK